MSFLLKLLWHYGTRVLWHGTKVLGYYGMALWHGTMVPGYYGTALWHHGARKLWHQDTLKLR